MKTKALPIILTLCLILSLFAGCTQKQQQPQQQSQQQQNNPPQTTPPETKPEVTTSASIVNKEDTFLKAISSTGNWIIAITQDLTINKDLVLDGEFKNGKKDANGKDQIQRKLALYAQDDKRNVTARYTLTAPKMTINSPYAGIWYGTFKGDLYVSAKNFTLFGAKIDGNVYFTTDEAKATFVNKDGTITGKTELKKPIE